MHWDDINKYRRFKPRNDNSIYVALGTYRDPYCPMTIKSLYNMAAHPEKLFVGLFQQNCFEKVCRTGVLKGGAVQNAGTDVDCYQEFCKSPEGQKSQACVRGQVRLFNVNESESLGPYMARYLGSKFYRGEQYYLQIDSHSEFVQDWDLKLLKMIDDAPARLPVISTYPPDSTARWRDSIGYRICDSEFAKAQIEWHIVRLGTGMQFDHSQADTPRYERRHVVEWSHVMSCRVVLYFTALCWAVAIHCNILLLFVFLQVCSICSRWFLLWSCLSIRRCSFRPAVAMDFHG